MKKVIVCLGLLVTGFLMVPSFGMGQVSRSNGAGLGAESVSSNGDLKNFPSTSTLGQLNCVSLLMTYEEFLSWYAQSGADAKWVIVDWVNVERRGGAVIAVEIGSMDPFQVDLTPKL